MQPDQSRLAVLQRRRIRKTRALDIVAAWHGMGVSAEVLSDERQEKLVEQLRGSSTRKRVNSSLQSIVEMLGNAGQPVVIIGWDIDHEPALLFDCDAVVRASAPLRTIYPEGFVAAGQPVTRAFIIDFDESGFEAEEVRLTAKG